MKSVVDWRKEKYTVGDNSDHVRTDPARLGPLTMRLLISLEIQANFDKNWPKHETKKSSIRAPLLFEPTGL